MTSEVNGLGMTWKEWFARLEEIRNRNMVMGTRDGEWIHPSDDYEIYGEDEF